MKIFKGYTKNHHHLKTSIVERYTTEEAIKLRSNDLSETDSIEIPKTRHDDRYEDRCTQVLNVKYDSRCSSSSTFVYIK